MRFAGSSCSDLQNDIGQRQGIFGAINIGESLVDTKSDVFCAISASCGIPFRHVYFLLARLQVGRSNLPYLSIDRKFDTVRRAALLLSFLRLFPRELHKTERDVHARPASLPQSYAAGGRLPGE